MARILTNGKIEFQTIDAAVRFVNNLSGKVRFSVRVSAFLPTEEDRGFEGITFLSVSRAQFIESVRGMGTILVDKRGGKVRLHLTAPRDGSELAFVSLY